MANRWNDIFSVEININILFFDLYSRKMKTATIVFLLFIGLVAIHHNSVQAEDETNFEEGKFSFSTQFSV